MISLSSFLHRALLKSRLRLILFSGVEGVPTYIVMVGRDNSKEYAVEPEDCPSTHGGAGLPLGTIFLTEKRFICPICGGIFEFQEREELGC